MRDTKTMTQEAKAQLAKRQFDRTNSMRQSVSGDSQNVAPNKKQSSVSDSGKSSSNSNSSVSSSRSNSSSNSSKDSDDNAGQGQNQMMQGQNYMQNVQLEAINEEDEHSERGKRPSNLV